MKMEAASSLNERRQFLLEVLRQCLVSIRVKSVLFHFELSDDPNSIRSSLYRATVDVLDSLIDAIESNDVPIDSSFFQRALSMATTTASSTTGTTPVDTKSQLFESGDSVGSATAAGGGGRTGGPLSTSSRKEEEEKEETTSLSRFQATITFQQQQIEILQQQLEERDNAYRVLEETCRDAEGRVSRLEQELLRVTTSMSSQQQQQREQQPQQQLQVDQSPASPQSPTSPSRRTGAFASYLARHEAVTSLEAQLKESSAQNQGLMGLLMLLLGVKTKKKRGDHGETKKEDSLRTADTSNHAVACSRLQTFSGTMRKLLAQHATMNAMAYLPNLSPLVDPDDMIWEDDEEDDTNDAEDPHQENRALRRVEAWLAQCEASVTPPQQQQQQAHLSPPPPPAASFLSYLAEAVDPTCWTVIAECKDSELRMLYQALEQCENRVLRVVQWKQYAKSLRRYARHLRRATIAMANTQQQQQQRGYPPPPPSSSSHPHSPEEGDGDGGDSSYSDWTTPNGSVASHGGLAPSSSSLSRGAAELSLGPTRSRDPTLLAVTSVVSSALGWATSQQNPLLHRAGVVGSHRGRSREHSSAGPSNKHASHFTFPSPPSRPQFSSESSASSASSASSGEAVDNDAQHTAGNSNKQQPRAWKQDTAKHHKHAKKRSAKQLASEKAAASAASRSMTMLSSDATRLKIMKTLRRQNTILHTKLAQILVEQQKLYWYLCVATIHPPPPPPPSMHSSSSASHTSESMIAQLRRHQESLDREVERRSELLRETFLLREQELDLLHRSYQGLATRLLQAEDAIQHAIRQLQVARVPLAPALEAYFPSQLGSGKTTDLTARDAARRGLTTSNSSSAAATAAVEELQSQQQAAIDQERSRASLMLQLAQEEEEFRQADRAVRFLESQIMEENERELSNPHGLKTVDPRWSLAVQEELATALRKRDALAADVGLLDSYCSTFVNELKLLREVLGKSLQRVAGGGGEAGGGANGGATVSHSAMGYKGGSSSARPRGDSILDALKRKIDSL